ncbi:Thioredoxin [uncultured archaeon]|nr:Thioredoxin [uncultured archaeon]
MAIMGLKIESDHLLLLFILCASIMLTTSWPVMGSLDKKANSTSINLGPEFPDAPLVITDSTLRSSLEKYSPLVLDCWEKGCRPCQSIDRKIDEMAADLKGQVVFGKLNIKQNARTATKYKVFNYPTILIFKNSALVYRHIGDIPKDELENLILSKLGIK